MRQVPLAAPAAVTIGADGHGDIAFGALQASLELGYSRSMVFFSWAGADHTPLTLMMDAAVNVCARRACALAAR